VLVLDDGEEAIEAITRFAQEQRLGGASLTAIGAFSNATLGFFDFAKKTTKIPVDEQTEVLSAISDCLVGEPGFDTHRRQPGWEVHGTVMKANSRRGIDCKKAAGQITHSSEEAHPLRRIRIFVGIRQRNFVRQAIRLRLLDW
jgi:hypothetical protein